MRLEDYFEFVEPDYIRIKGHRIGIESILRKYLAGEAAEEIAHQYDTLRPVDIYATITYYLENQAAVDAYLARTEALVTEDMARSDAAPSPAVLRLRRLRELRGEEGQAGGTSSRAHA
jgi:uncharacterized protein (DUF433 family)